MSQPTPDLPASAPAALAISAAGARQWKAGTLVFSGAGLVVLFCWLLWGDFAWQMKERAAVPVAQLMLRQLQASDFVVGLLVGSIPAAIGFIITPIISGAMSLFGLVCIIEVYRRFRLLGGMNGYRPPGDA
jgi:hypothetical protein